jgi:hypothetical protein
MGIFSSQPLEIPCLHHKTEVQLSSKICARSLEGGIISVVENYSSTSTNSEYKTCQTSWTRNELERVPIPLTKFTDPSEKRRTSLTTRKCTRRKRIWMFSGVPSTETSQRQGGKTVHEFLSTFIVPRELQRTPPEPNCCIEPEPKDKVKTQIKTKSTLGVHPQISMEHPMVHRLIIQVNKRATGSFLFAFQNPAQEPPPPPPARRNIMD